MEMVSEQLVEFKQELHKQSACRLLMILVQALTLLLTLFQFLERERERERERCVRWLLIIATSR